MTYKGHERERSWFLSRYYPSVCLEGPRKITNNFRKIGLWVEIEILDVPNVTRSTLCRDFLSKLFVVSEVKQTKILEKKRQKATIVRMQSANWKITHLQDYWDNK
jgi:hypothetical protein